MFLDPLAATIRAYNRMAEGYAERWFSSAEIAEFVKLFDQLVRPQGSIIDAGCGSGREIAALTKLGRDCIGVDLSANLVAVARSKVEDGYFRIMDIRDITYPDSLFGGVLCIACLHHLHDEDARRALISFAKVLEPEGVAGLTIRLGEGEEYDDFGRFIKYRSEEQFHRLLGGTSFQVEKSLVSKDDSGREWLQVILRNRKQDRSDTQSFCPFCQSGYFFANNRISHLPIAASILWGDSKSYIAIDRSPLCEGHLLVCSRQHALSMMSSDLTTNEIIASKLLTEDLLWRTYGRKPVFLEHGVQRDSKDLDSCVEHAHVHALPLKTGIKAKIEGRINRLRHFRDERGLRNFLSGREYISYEDKRGRVYFRDEGVANLPSQFFRRVIAEDMGKTEEQAHWRSVLNDADVLRNFRRTIKRLTETLDADEAEKQIHSHLPEAITGLLQAREAVELKNEKSAKATRIEASLRRRIDGIGQDYAVATLADLGEERITQDIIYRFFDEGYRGIKYLGDDSAVFSPRANEDIAITVDPCPTPVFFELGEKSFRAFGWLALTISLSDIAATGAEPFAALLNCEMPESMLVSEFVDFLDGVLLASDRYGCRVIGGNIREANRFGAATTVLGSTTSRRRFQRDGATEGDGVFVVGNMGLFWASIVRRLEEPLIEDEHVRTLEGALFFPQAQVRTALELAKHGLVSACMDSSDGPTRCFDEIARRSDVNIEIEYSLLTPHPAVEAVGRHVSIDPVVLMLTWGNFELVFTANEQEIADRYQETIYRDVLKKVGRVVKGRGEAKIIKGKHVNALPDLSSIRFKSRNSLVSGVIPYYNYLKEVQL